jgi:hypothetical protein
MTRSGLLDHSITPVFRRGSGTGTPILEEGTMIDRLQHTARRGTPLALAALLVLTSCASDGEEEGQGEAVAAVVDDGSGETDDGLEDAGSDDDSGDDRDESGSEDPDEDSADDEEDEKDDKDEEDEEEEDPYDGDDPYDTGDLTNECPDDGCLVRIIEAEPSDGEIILTFDANFAPDISGNHFHIYWNNWEPAEVSADTSVGKWEAKDDYPGYNTGDGGHTSVTSDAREESSEICVTPADGSHVVIDEDVYDCWEVGELIG